MSKDAKKVLELVENAFKKGGYLGSIGFLYSQTQYDYAVAFAASLFEKSQVNMFEASTGTGKTISYLITSLLYSAITGKKTIIATHTIALQKQMMAGDLSVAMAYLDECGIIRPIVEQRIGRQNYIDPVRIKRKIYFLDHVDSAELDRFLSFCLDLCTTGSGLIDDVVEAYGCIPFGLSKDDICLNNNASDESNLAYVAAKQDTLDADVIITSHMMLLSSIGKDVLGTVESGHNIVLDEADLIVSSAENITSQLIQPTFILSNLRKSRACLTTKGRALLDVLEEKLEATITWFDDEYAGNKLKALHSKDDSGSALTQLGDIVRGVSELKKFVKKSGRELPEFGYLDDIFYLNELAANRLDNYGQLMGLHYSPVINKPSFLISQSLPASMLKYFSNRGASLFFTSATFRDLYRKEQAISFDSFTRKLGLKSDILGKMLSFEPVKFGSVNYILADKGVAAPIIRSVAELNPSWLQYVTQALLNIAHNKEKALVLCGSFKEVSEYQKRLMKGNITFHTSGSLGDAARHHQENNTDMLITPSAWEGFSLRKEDGAQHFKRVVITKIPFSPPNEINEVRLNKYYSDKGILNGKSRASAILSAENTQSAITKLIQGAGRLLRGVDDSGEIWVLDPRFPHTGDSGRNQALHNMIPKRFKESFNSHKVWSREGRLTDSSSTEHEYLLGVI